MPPGTCRCVERIVTNNMTRIQELLAASVNNGLKLSQQLCRCPAILSVQMGSESVSPSVW